jgi:diaminopimelate decarboxylase
MIDHRTHLSVNNKGNLEIGGVDTIDLAREFRTPLYVTDEDRIRSRFNELYGAFSSHGYEVKIKYAYKANTSLAILKILKDCRAGADVLSEGEIKAALHIGISPDDIIFTGNNKTDDELLLAIQKGIVINIDSLHELHRIRRICSEKDVRRAKVSFRINPAVSPKTHPYLATGLRESKFGIAQKEALKAYRLAKEDRNISIEGIHMHIGSQILDPGVYGEAALKLMNVVCDIKKKLGVDLRFIDIGGGFGIKYREDDRYISPGEFANVIFKEIDRAVEECALRRPEVFIEPGRFLVGDSTVLLTTVNTVKETPYKKFIGVDAGFNTLVRPALYKAYHEAVVANKMEKEAKEVVTIAGNVCESGDLLANNRSLPKIEEGDIIAFLDAGAYGLVMASQYNLRPRPAAVLVSNGRWILIRKRETFEDLIEKEILPSEL